MIKRYTVYQDGGVGEDEAGEFVPWDEAVEALRQYGTHVDGCLWQVFPPGSRDCSCGLHEIIGVPDFAVPQKGNDNG